MRQRTYPQSRRPDDQRPDDQRPDVQPADSATSSASALQAVQVALDRRDNGGDTQTGDDE